MFVCARRVDMRKSHFGNRRITKKESLMCISSLAIATAFNMNFYLNVTFLLISFHLYTTRMCYFVNVNGKSPQKRDAHRRNICRSIAIHHTFIHLDASQQEFLHYTAAATHRPIYANINKFVAFCTRFMTIQSQPILSIETKCRAKKS